MRWFGIANEIGKKREKGKTKFEMRRVKRAMWKDAVCRKQEKFAIATNQRTTTTTTESIDIQQKRNSASRNSALHIISEKYRTTNTSQHHHHHHLQYLIEFIQKSKLFKIYWKVVVVVVINCHNAFWLHYTTLLLLLSLQLRPFVPLFR